MIARKVYAYITHGSRLLVFRHVDFPEAGLQVPGGTVEDGEDFETAVKREAWEETGLTGLMMKGFVGESVEDRSDPDFQRLEHRRYYHLVCTKDPPATWQHVEERASDGSGPIQFGFFWVDLPDGVPKLAGDQDHFISCLKK